MTLNLSSRLQILLSPSDTLRFQPVLMSLARPTLVCGPSNAKSEWPGPEDNYKETRMLNRRMTEAAGIRCLRFSTHWDLSGAGGGGFLHSPILILVYFLSREAVKGRALPGALPGQ